jgi:phosphohistidine phosphatase
MKHLLLLRHAKSCWKDLNLTDHDRPLNKRGNKSAPKMGEKLKNKDIRPELIITSTAIRALSTAEFLAQKINYSLANIHFNQNLYHASTQDMLNICSQCSDKISNLMLVGHNPGMTLFANQLLKYNDECFVNIPTAGLVTMSINIDSWTQIKDPNTLYEIQLLDYDYPKK